MTFEGPQPTKLEYCISMNAFDLLRRMPPEYGIVINPGADVGFDLPPGGIQDIVKDFSLGHS